MAGKTSLRKMDLSIRNDYFRGRRLTGLRPREFGAGGFMTSMPQIVRKTNVGGRPLQVHFPHIVDFKTGMSLDMLKVSVDSARTISLGGKIGTGEGIILREIDSIQFDVYPFIDSVGRHSEVAGVGKNVDFKGMGSSFKGEIRLPELEEGQEEFDGWLHLMIKARLAESMTPTTYSTQLFEVALPLPGEHLLGMNTMFERFSSQVSAFGVETIKSTEFKGLGGDGMDIEIRELNGSSEKTLVGVRVLGGDMPSIGGVEASYFVGGLPFATRYNSNGYPTHMVFPSMFDLHRDAHLSSFNVQYEQDGRVRLTGRFSRGENPIPVSEAHAILIRHDEKVYGVGELVGSFTGGFNYENTLGAFNVSLKAPSEVNPFNGGWGVLKIVPDNGGEKEIFTTFPMPSGRMEAFTRMMKSFLLHAEERSLFA